MLRWARASAPRSSISTSSSSSSSSTASTLFRKHTSDGTPTCTPCHPRGHHPARETGGKLRRRKVLQSLYAAQLPGLAILGCSCPLAGAQLRTWRARRMCSRVCGMGPSGADTTRMPPSICAAPVIMFCTPTPPNEVSQQGLTGRGGAQTKADTGKLNHNHSRQGGMYFLSFFRRRLLEESRPAGCKASRGEAPGYNLLLQLLRAAPSLQLILESNYSLSNGPPGRRCVPRTPTTECFRTGVLMLLN